MLPIKFFDIQITFAKKVSELQGIDLPEALLKYTFLYRNYFVPSQRFVKSQKVWQEFLQEFELHNTKSVTEVAFEFSKKRLIERNMFDRPLYSGKPCFIYEIKNKDVYLHFNNNEGSNPGPLSKDRISARTEELTYIFRQIKDEHQDIESVKGYSWLYNLESYRRLFPPEFTVKRVKFKNDFKSLDIWGQFLDSRYQLKDTEAEIFINKVCDSKNLSQLYNSFQYYPIRVQAPIEDFFKFYGI